MKSTFLNLNGNDYIKGLIMAVGTGFLASFGQFLEQWSQPNSTLNLVMAKISFILALKVAVGAGVTYLIKNFVTNSSGSIAVKEPVAVNVAPVINPSGGVPPVVVAAENDIPKP